MTGSDRRARFIIALALVLLTITAFGRVLQAEFVMLDDDEYVTRNLHVQSGLTRDSVRWALTTSSASFWHPLIWLSYMLDYEVWKLNPLGYHLTNLLLHVASVVLLFFILARMTGSIWRSAFVAALFAVHPLRVESVAWIAERKDVLSTLFWMLTMWAYVRYVEFKVQGSRFKVGAYALVVVFFALGLMAKPMLVTLPFVFLILDYWPLGRFRGSPHPDPLPLRRCTGEGVRSPSPVRDSGSGTGEGGDEGSGLRVTRYSLLVTKPSSTSKKLMLEKLPLLPLVAASTVITYIAQQKGGALSSFERLPMALRIPNALVSYIKYIGMMLWPAKLGVLYPHPRATLPVWLVLVSALILVILTFLAFRASRRRPWIGAGWVWYIVTMLPVIGIVQVGPHALADRFTYIPHIGLYLILAWGVPEFVNGRKGEWEKGRKEEGANGRSSIPPFLHSSILPLSAGIVLTALMVVTWTQTGYWRDSVRLFKRTISVTHRNAMIFSNLGSVLAEKGRLREAELYLLRARDIGHGARVETNLGVVAEKLGRTAEAEERYRRALQLDATYVDAHYNLGNVLFRKGRLREAAEEYSQALKLDPESADAAFKLGLSRAGLGRTDEAASYYYRALRIDPRHVRAHRKLADLLAAQGKTEEAMAHYSRALELEPDDADAHYNLGSLLGQTGRLDEEIEHYRAAIRINPKLAEAHGNLAVALYYKGRYAEAWEEVELCRKYGATPSPDFVRALSEKLPR